MSVRVGKHVCANHYQSENFNYDYSRASGGKPVRAVHFMRSDSRQPGFGSGLGVRAVWSAYAVSVVAMQ